MGIASTRREGIVQRMDEAVRGQTWQASCPTMKQEDVMSERKGWQRENQMGHELERKKTLSGVAHKMGQTLLTSVWWSEDKTSTQR
jgi:hypothetical protein